MSIEQVISSISALSPADQLRVVNAIWENLPNDVAEMVPPDEAKILKDRLESFEANPMSLVSEDELRNELNERRNK